MNRINEFTEVVILDAVHKDTIFEYGKVYHSLESNYIFFMCPCGCGATESIKQGSRTQIPNVTWKFQIKNGEFTIRPSMYMRMCISNSHYWITDNKIHWL